MQNSGKKSGGFKRTSELLKRRITQASEGRVFLKLGSLRIGVVL